MDFCLNPKCLHKNKNNYKLFLLASDEFPDGDPFGPSFWLCGDCQKIYYRILENSIKIGPEGIRPKSEDLF